MEKHRVITQIEELELEAKKLIAGETDEPDDLREARLRALRRELDRYWEMLRYRNMLREYGSETGTRIRDVYSLGQDGR